MSASTWTDERVETLTQLWRDGASASQIARDLGGVTRNAVIGKVHRLGLMGRSTPSTPGARRAKPKGEQRLRRAPVVAGTPLRALPPGVAVAPSPETGTASIVSVGYGQCRWPIGDPVDEGFCLCGRAATRGAYCAPHGAVAYRPTPRDHLLRLAGVR